MTTDYDRISADDLSCQTEDRLDHTEGEQTTETVKGRGKRAKGAAKTSSAKKSAKKTAKTGSAKTRSAKTATKAQARAQASQQAEAQLVLRQRIEAVFDDGVAQTAKERAAQKRTAKTEAKGLVWTLSALALAACGGGGGGSPAPVTGGTAGATGPQTATGGGNARFESGARLTTTILSQTERDGDTVNLRDAAEDAAGRDDDTIMDVNFRETGTFTVETARIPSDMMVAVEVGGIVDPTTGIQNGGAGDDVLNGVDGDNTLTGGVGADEFVLNLNGTGTTTVTDFNSSDGDRVRVDTSDGTETSLSMLGLNVQNDNGNAQIVNATDASEIYMILNNISHQHVIDNFNSYFDVM